MEEIRLFGFNATILENLGIWKLGSASSPPISTSDHFKLKQYIIFIEAIAVRLEQLNQK